MQQPISKYISGNLPRIDLIYKALFDFMDNALEKFCPLTIKDNGKIVTAEDNITEDLADFLDSEQESYNGFFKFTNQSRRADIGVKYGRTYKQSNRYIICWIEAKRLPTPLKSDRDPREYVYVDKEKYRGNGGIQRFKTNQHGEGLPYAIMIGYIQKYDSKYWLSMINSYITDLANDHSQVLWGEDDILFKDDTCLSGMGNRFISKHKRVDKNNNMLPNIIIHHYWVKL